MCYTKHPLNEEEAVQTGLIEWKNGNGDSPTWTVLVKAMEHARIPVQQITKLKEELLKGAHSQLINRANQLFSMHMLHKLYCVQAVVSILVHWLHARKFHCIFSIIRQHGSAVYVGMVVVVCML